MGRVIAIVGLPGSGKTHFAIQLGLSLNAPVVDDPKVWKTDVEPILLSHIDGTVIITDPHFCYASARESATKMITALGFEIEWRFFENDLESCRKNCFKRANENPERSKIFLDLEWFSKNYDIPQCVKTIPVWNND